jgi:hypothetical protein
MPQRLVNQLAIGYMPFIFNLCIHLASEITYFSSFQPRRKLQSSKYTVEYLIFPKQK